MAVKGTCPVLPGLCKKLFLAQRKEMLGALCGLKRV